jgi:single stranded DNA-binding protein
MNRGIETAFWATLGKDPELKTSKSGKPFATFNVAVTVGHADDGKDQWVRVACFGQVAEEIAARAAKSDRLYIEGSLTLNTWTTSAGEQRSGLSVAAWKCERVASIGKNRQFREKGHEIAPSTFKSDTRRDAEAVFKPAPEKRFELNDEIPF